MMRAWISPLLAERGVWRVGPKLDCARLPHYCPSRAAPGHAGPTALITADSPTSALILLQTLPSLLLCVQSVGRCDGRGRRGDAELLLDTRHALSPVCHHLVSLLYCLLDLFGGETTDRGRSRAEVLVPDWRGALSVLVFSVTEYTEG